MNPRIGGEEARDAIENFGSKTVGWANLIARTSSFKVGRDQEEMT